MKTICILLLALFALASAEEAYATTAPVIGIVTNPADGFDKFPENLFSYFYASYVKYLEQAGAQVVPIFWYQSQEKLGTLLGKLNGVLFTGGSNELADPKGKLTPFGASLDFILNYAIQQNKAGKYYPVWGTCMGFQAIAGLVAKNFSILTGDCDGCYGVNKNNFYNQGYNSRLYAGLSADLKQKLTSTNLTVYFHHYMYHYSTWEKFPILNTTLTPATYSFDDRGVKYVSSFESPTMPIYGTQYHPEKNAFEFRSTYAMNRSPDAILLQQYLANFFVNECRKNTNVFPEKQSYIIENYIPVVLPNNTVTQIYFFPKVTTEERSQVAGKEDAAGFHSHFRRVVA